MKKESKAFGFSLAEVLIVVAIISLLALMAIPNLLRARVDSNQTFAQTTLKAIANALENYVSINSAYPTDVDELIGVSPPYLNKNYFVGAYNGYTFDAELDSYSYTITAIPVNSSSGTTSYTITTGAVLTVN